MNEEKPSKSRNAGESLRKGGQALAIPMVLVSYPLVMVFLGKLLADWAEQPWITPVALVIGLFLGVRECVLLVKRLSSD